MDLSEYHKRRRTANFRRKTAFYSLLFLIFASAIWGFFWAPFFRISKIETVGADNPHGIEQAVSVYLASLNRFFLPNNHFVLLSTEEIKSLLKTGGFGLASAEKIIPNRLEIKFEKSEPWLIFCETSEACYYIDEKGALSERSPVFSENPLPQIRSGDLKGVKLGDGIIPAEDAVFLKEWFSSLKTIGEAPAEIEFLKKGEIKILLKKGWFIYLAGRSSPEKIFWDLKLLLDQKIKDARPKLEYIDLRFENKAFYKL